jgi:hypothetical protein
MELEAFDVRDLTRPATSRHTTSRRINMTRKVLLLGRTTIVVDDVREQLRMPDIHLFAGTGIDDVRSAFAQGGVDHVIMGAGIELETRLQIVREIFGSSETTTVHMKDHLSGSAGFLPFVRSVLGGLSDYEV